MYQTFPAGNHPQRSPKILHFLLFQISKQNFARMLLGCRYLVPTVISLLITHYFGLELDQRTVPQFKGTFWPTLHVEWSQPVRPFHLGDHTVTVHIYSVEYILKSEERHLLLTYTAGVFQWRIQLGKGRGQGDQELFSDEDTALWHRVSETSICATEAAGFLMHKLDSPTF